MEQNGRENASALKPLHAARDALEVLRTAEADPTVRRSAIIRVTHALEGSLRRFLRDDPHAPLEARLRALAPDELPADELLAELRRRDRISIELAAGFHELAGVLRRVREGAPATQEDAELALRTVERVEWEAVAPPPAPVPLPATEEVYPEEETMVHPVPPAGRGRGAGPKVAAVVLGLLLLLVLGWIWRGWSQGRELERGIAAYKRGEAVAASEHFRRYAESSPEDPTPRVYLARIHRRAGRFNEARDEIGRGLRVSPSDAALHRELGYLLLDAGRPGEAVARFRTALKTDSQSTEAWLGLIRALRAAGHEDAAARALLSAPAEVRALVGGRGAAPAPGAAPTP